MGEKVTEGVAQIRLCRGPVRPPQNGSPGSTCNTGPMGPSLSWLGCSLAARSAKSSNRIKVLVGDATAARQGCQLGRVPVRPLPIRTNFSRTTSLLIPQPFRALLPADMANPLGERV